MTAMESVECLLLLVVGEPVTDDHKDLILAEVVKGKLDLLLFWS